MLLGRHIIETFNQRLSDLTSKVTPSFTTDITSPSIVYFIRPNSGGYVPQTTIDLRIIWKDFDEAEAIAERVIDVFDTKENETGVVLDDLTFRGGLSGGGGLFRDDLQMWEFSYIFILKIKESNKNG